MRVRTIMRTEPALWFRRRIATSAGWHIALLYALDETARATTTLALIYALCGGVARESSRLGHTRLLIAWSVRSRAAIAACLPPIVLVQVPSVQT